MLKIRRPSPTLGVALLALFIALGGTGIAAVTAVPSNSVGTAQLRNDSVTRAKIAHQSITSVLIKPGSLMASDFAAGQIPAGPKGDTGATGATGAKGDTGARGATGPAGVVGLMGVVHGHVTVGHNSAATVQVYVDVSKQAIGASARWDTSLPGLGFISVQPLLGASGQPVGYEAQGYNDTGASHTITLYVSYG
jgi:hypothetical protein